MKDKKQFKLGAMYKLKKKYINQLLWTDDMTKHLGFVGVFKFKVTVISEDGVAGTRIGDEDLFIAQPSERHMFKRIDNK